MSNKRLWCLSQTKGSLVETTSIEKILRRCGQRVQYLNPSRDWPPDKENNPMLIVHEQECRGRGFDRSPDSRVVKGPTRKELRKMVSLGGRVGFLDSLTAAVLRALQMHGLLTLDGISGVPLADGGWVDGVASVGSTEGDGTGPRRYAAEVIGCDGALIDQSFVYNSCGFALREACDGQFDGIDKHMMPFVLARILLREYPDKYRWLKNSSDSIKEAAAKLDALWRKARGFTKQGRYVRTCVMAKEEHEAFCMALASCLTGIDVRIEFKGYLWFAGQTLKDQSPPEPYAKWLSTIEPVLPLYNGFEVYKKKTGAKVLSRRRGGG